MSFSMNHSPKRQTGLGMIEVLIAMLIFAMGVLGMATMQINAKRTSYDALQRSLATSLTRDIVERMRSNPSPAALAIFGAVDDLGGGSKGAEPAPNCRTASCSATELAAHDIWEWERALDGASETFNGNNAGGLMNPRACITHVNGVITVAIAWQGHGNGLINPTNSDCGEGLNLYGANEVDRQIIVVRTYIEEV